MNISCTIVSAVAAILLLTGHTAPHPVLPEPASAISVPAVAANSIALLCSSSSLGSVGLSNET